MSAIRRTIVKSIEYVVLNSKGEVKGTIELPGKYRQRAIKTEIYRQLGVNIGKEYQYFPQKRIEEEYVMPLETFIDNAEMVRRNVFEL